MTPDTAMNDTRFPELGYYALPGHALSPKSIFAEVQSGDELGLGSVWISERFNTKDIGVMSGIAAALSHNMGIATGLISNLPLRHPVIVAGLASTMATLTDGRFALGIGRGVDPIADASGTPRLTFRLLEDYVGILRRLWRGEKVTYHGPAGNLAGISLGMALENPPPIIMAAMGDRTCEWAGRHCDGVVFNSLWSCEAVANSSARVRKGAEEAGRDPEAVRIWTIQITACETSEEDVLNYVVRRMNTYLLFPPMFCTICEHNGWDPAVADRLRAALAEIDGAAAKAGVGDEHTTRDLDALRRVRDLYPAHWIADGNAVGSATQCAKATRARLDAGADSILFHGSPPAKLAPLLERWPDHRPSGRFAELAVNPGR